MLTWSLGTAPLKAADGSLCLSCFSVRWCRSAGLRQSKATCELTSAEQTEKRSMNLLLWSTVWLSHDFHLMNFNLIWIYCCSYLLLNPLFQYVHLKYIIMTLICYYHQLRNLNFIIPIDVLKMWTLLFVQTRSGKNDQLCNTLSCIMGNIESKFLLCSGLLLVQRFVLWSSIYTGFLSISCCTRRLLMTSDTIRTMNEVYEKKQW